ncbi:hypothetical protein [Flavobacterium sp.]|uniref:hypothetical protein n=1 Tax=Flavobacterium sp. TaxID=239 RepID=UPI001B5E1446|nr:hypothetical protein [Flavobacterium sp.]MBP6183107.1 hypothetical protein [Flavobacterium sp.]
MSTLEIKLEIFDKLKEVEDISLLKKIRNLLKSIPNETSYVLSEAEIEMLEMSEDDIKAGRVMSQEQLDKEDLEWLSKP